MTTTPRTLSETERREQTLAAALLLFGIGGANAMAPATDAVMAALPESRAGVGSALNDTTRQVGGALGVGIFGSILNSLYTSNVASSVAELPSELAVLAKNSIGAAIQVAADLDPAAGQALVNSAGRAFVDSTGVVYVVMGTVAVIDALITLWFMPARDIVPGEESEIDLAIGAAPEPVPVRIDPD